MHRHPQRQEYYKVFFFFFSEHAHSESNCDSYLKEYEINVYQIDDFQDVTHHLSMSPSIPIFFPGSLNWN